MLLVILKKKKKIENSTIINFFKIFQKLIEKFKYF